MIPLIFESAYGTNEPFYNRNRLTGIGTRCEVAKGKKGGTGGMD